MARKPVSRMPDATAPRVPARPRCDGVDCQNFAAPGRTNCVDCATKIRQAASEAWCEAHGLRTAEQKRDYCRRMAGGIFRTASFDTWAKNMTQKTVDLIVINGGPTDEHCLERLRVAGVIDSGNKLIPLEGREIAAAAHRAERARLICERQAELEARGVVEREAGQGETGSNAT